LHGFFVGIKEGPFADNQGGRFEHPGETEKSPSFSSLGVIDMNSSDQGK
jgi:hypothetical protein